MEEAVFKIITDYERVLRSTAKRPLGVPESKLPHSKADIKRAIREALQKTDDRDGIEALKADYIALADFVPDEAVPTALEGENDRFAFLQMDEESKRKFLRERYKTGLIGDYELAVRKSEKIAAEMKRLKREIDEFLREIKSS